MCLGYNYRTYYIGANIVENMNEITLELMLSFYKRINEAQDAGIEEHHLMAKGIGQKTAWKALKNNLSNPTMKSLGLMLDAVDEFMNGKLVEDTSPDSDELVSIIDSLIDLIAKYSIMIDATKINKKRARKNKNMTLSKLLNEDLMVMFRYRNKLSQDLVSFKGLV